MDELSDMLGAGSYIQWPSNTDDPKGCLYERCSGYSNAHICPADGATPVTTRVVNFGPRKFGSTHAYAYWQRLYKHPGSILLHKQ